MRNWFLICFTFIFIVSCGESSSEDKTTTITTTTKEIKKNDAPLTLSGINLEMNLDERVGVLKSKGYNCIENMFMVEYVQGDEPYTYIEKDEYVVCHIGDLSIKKYFSDGKPTIVNSGREDKKRFYSWTDREVSVLEENPDVKAVLMTADYMSFSCGAFNLCNMSLYDAKRALEQQLDIDMRIDFWENPYVQYSKYKLYKGTGPLGDDITIKAYNDEDTKFDVYINKGYLGRGGATFD